MDERLLSDFLAEAEESVEELYGELAELRVRRDEGAARRELVARIFRRVHTLKGGASTAGLEATAELAHELEALLDAVRLGRADVDEEMLDASREAVGAVAASLEAASHGEAGVAPRDVVGRLRRLASAVGAADAGPDESEAALPPEVARAIGAHERQRLLEAMRDGARAYVVTADFDLSTFDEQYRRLSAALAEMGEVISTRPFADADRPEHVGFRIVFACAARAAEVLRLVAPLDARLSGDYAESSEDEEVVAADVETGTRAVAAPKLVRVPLEELDDLISEAHGLFAETFGALVLAAAAEGGAHTESNVEFEERAWRVRSRFSELEKRLVGLRMTPLRATLARCARAGESVARAAGKSVEFETAGGDVRLDRSLADALAGPLLHLVRNAVDHGIETTEERRAAGKPERGRVRVEASAEGGRISIRVSDDGRGVDVESVARSAREHGLVPSGAGVTDETALRLIFRPGFSTASDATLISGRGVGLDVVERAVEEAGGEVRVRSERGHGTVFELRLPATLALLPSRVVRCAGHAYCLSRAQVVDAGRSDGDGVKPDGGALLRWRGRELPSVHLSELLGQGARHGEETARTAFVIARARIRRGSAGDEGERHVAVLVDELGEEAEALVRGLGRHAARWRGVSGAAELRDGEIALVLDLPRLLEPFGVAEARP